MLVVTSHKIVGPTKFPLSYSGICKASSVKQASWSDSGSRGCASNKVLRQARKWIWQ